MTQQTKQQVRLVEELLPYHRLVLALAAMCKKRRFKPWQVEVDDVIEMATTNPAMTKLVDEMDWKGWLPVAKVQALHRDVVANMKFYASRIYWSGEEILVQSFCEHGKSYFCEKCRMQGIERLDGVLY
jgi:hypothetical protein